MIDLKLGDCLEVLKTIPDNSVDSIVTDPPYGIGFMNKEWDKPSKHRELIEREKKRSEERFEDGKSPVKGGFSKGVQPGLPIGTAKEGRWFQEWCEQWGKECLRVLKPGGYLLSFSAPRTYHRMTTGFEDAGFEIRDQIMWVFGSGFPKSLNIGKAIDKLQGNEREVIGKKIQRVDGTTRNKQPNGGFMKDNVITKESDGYIDVTKPGSPESQKWEGWGTALKPAHEPICVARKPLSEKTNAENVMKWGTGGINIDDCRIGYNEDKPHSVSTIRENEGNSWNKDYQRTDDWKPNNEGRWPANIIMGEGEEPWRKYFYCPKASKKDRDEGLNNFPDYNKYEDTCSDNHSFSHLVKEGKQVLVKNIHPTVKPTDLMLYLIRLVTPKGGTTLDPFTGSGSTGKAAIRGGFSFIGIEKEEEYIKISQARINNERN